MSRFGFVFGTVLVCGLTGYSGWLHSSVVSGQRVSEILQEVGERLESLPKEAVGPWQLVSEDAIRADAAKMLEASGYIMRTYKHSSRGWRVRAFVVVGPHGPVSVHTPDVCFPANDFTIEAGPKAIGLRDTSERKHQLWNLHLRSNNSDRQGLNAIYGWSRDGRWTAPKQPRVSFIGSPYLYKIQVETETDPNSPTTDEACRDFLTEFLPTLRDYVVR